MEVVLKFNETCNGQIVQSYGNFQVNRKELIISSLQIVNLHADIFTCF